MRVTEKVKETVERDVTTRCNKCGEIIWSVKPNQKKSSGTSGGAAKIFFGWGSKKFDQTDFYFDLCDNCWQEFMDLMKHKPEKVERIGMI
jgi:hypothetical protein